ncbi:MAG: hypothetical protein NUW37_17030 [Planctomycetes bacterium]|nr:hypothetical protein [Planctomycetota bacterium]
MNVISSTRLLFLSLALIGVGAATSFSGEAPAEPADDAASEESATSETPETSESSAETQASDAVEEKPEVKIPDWVFDVKIYGKAYIRYSYDLSRGADDYNEFDLDRIYLRFDWTPEKDVKIHYTMEGGEVRDHDVSGTAVSNNGGGRFDVTSKHFFIEKKNLLLENFSLKFGQIDLPWVPYEETVWGYRVYSKVLADRWGYMTSTDLGLGLNYKFPEKLGELQAVVVNGEGWKKNETGKHKDFHARLTLTPLSSLGEVAGGFFLTAFYSSGQYENVDFDSKKRAVGYIGFRDKESLTIAASYMATVDLSDKMKSPHPSLASNPGVKSEGRGIGALIRLNFGFTGVDVLSNFEIVSRLDTVDPDTDIDDNSVWFGMWGVDYRFSEFAHGILGYEVVDYERNAGKSDEDRIVFAVEVSF